MKLVRFGHKGFERPGIISSDGTIRDLSHVVSDITGAGLRPEGLERIARIDPDDLPRAPEDARIGPCIAMPYNFVAIGLNYVDHAQEANMPIPEQPIIFNKAPTSISGPYDDVVLPVGAKKGDWEVELGIVIGSPCDNVSEADAMDYVAGFCVCNDVSERQYQMEMGGEWVKGKSAPSFGPLGPWMVTKDEIADPHNLSMYLDLNGKRMQDGNTANMIFKVDLIVSYVSRFIPLIPGDVIVTGTPAGVGLGMKPQVFLKPGDEMVLGIEGLGEQRQSVVAHPKESAPAAAPAQPVEASEPDEPIELADADETPETGEPAEG
ncbi:fumarylacetoacetate hydrolase family protein [Tepidamorphus sp. 3E244]|uniref:fumarylacetoacetate hydrolase family protein n=1 Tax=Tepidamorphus sp. 3E244 TaxID=3385498 RepID=UPI0038FC2407